MKVIVACRLSKLHDGSTGLDSQEQETVRWAERETHSVVDVVQDAVSGAKTILARRRLRPWLTEPEKLAQYDGIVVYRMDRLTRGDSAETRRIEDWADSHGKTLMTEDGLVFPCEGADGIRWDLAKRMSHDEWLKIKERYGRMQRTVRERGGYVGRPPWGFALDGSPKVLMPVEGSRDIITQAFALAAEGAHLRVIGAVLSEATGLPWHERTVQRMLRNPAYEAIAGTRLAAEARTALESRRYLGRDSVTAPKALLAKVKCGNPACDATGPKPSPMYRIATPALHYRCCGNGPRRRGCGNMVPLEALDALVLGAVEYWEQQDRVDYVYVPASDSAGTVAALRARLATASRAEANDLYDQIEALEAKGSRPAHWAEQYTGKTVGEWLQRASLNEQRDYLARQDIRAWHEGARIKVTVNGVLAVRGGASAITQF